MNSYIYSRDWLAGKGYWDIGYNNPGAEPPIVEPCICGEIFVALGYHSRLHCNGDECEILFEEELTPEEEDTLDAVIAAHKAAANA